MKRYDRHNIARIHSEINKCNYADDGDGQGIWNTKSEIERGDAGRSGI